MQSQTIEIFVCALKITMKSQFQTNPNIPFDKEKGMLDSKNFTTFFYSLNKLSENELLLCVSSYYASMAMEKIFFKLFVSLYLLFYWDLAYL